MPRPRLPTETLDEYHCALKMEADLEARMARRSVRIIREDKINRKMKRNYMKAEIKRLRHASKNQKPETVEAEKKETNSDRVPNPVSLLRPARISS